MQVKFRDDPAVIEPGGAMALDLWLDVGPPGRQLRRRFRQRGSENFFDLVERQFDLFCRSGLIPEPLVQGQILFELRLLCYRCFLSFSPTCSQKAGAPDARGSPVVLRWR